MHESLDEFKFRQDPTTDDGVSCPLASKNAVNNLAPSFLLESSFMPVTSTSIIARTSSKFSTTRPHTVELASFERLKKFP